MLFQVVASGITAGAVYALVALAFVLIYKGTRVVNFGQGEQVMLGGYLVLVLNTFAGLPFWLAVVLALSLAGLLGVLIEFLVLRRILPTTLPPSSIAAWPERSTRRPPRTHAPCENEMSFSLREAFFSRPYPAQTLVEVTRLAMRDFLVEADVTAVVPE